MSADDTLPAALFASYAAMLLLMSRCCCCCRQAAMRHFHYLLLTLTLYADSACCHCWRDAMARAYTATVADAADASVFRYSAHMLVMPRHERCCFIRASATAAIRAMLYILPCFYLRAMRC